MGNIGQIAYGKIKRIEKDLNSRGINIMDLGAVGDGIADDTFYLQKAIDRVQDNGGGIVFIPKRMFKIDTVYITKPYVVIDGMGTLLNGKIVVGNETIPTDLYFKIKNIYIRHSNESIRDGSTGIELQNARIGDIKNVTFRNIDKPIYYRPIASKYYHQCEKIKMEENIFKNCNYCLFVDRPEIPTQQYQVGDITFSDNYAFGDIYKKHAHILGVDGLKFNDNVLFFPGHIARNTTKEQNLYIDYGNFISISGNQLFEAGYEGIFMSRCRNFTVEDNRIAWPGQRRPGDAILIKDGDQNNQIYNVGTISNNQIDFPSKHGISLENGCGYVTIGSGNTIRDVGNSFAYYGETELTSFTHYGITCDVTCQFIHALGNTLPDDHVKLFGANNVSHFNLESGRVFRNTYYVLYVEGMDKTIEVAKYDGINLMQPSSNIIESFTGGFDGKEITCLATNNNTGFKHGLGPSQFRLKGGVNATMPQHSTIKFMFSNSGWYEISRSF